MNYWDKKLIRKQLDKKLKKLKPLLKITTPSGGWIHAIREGLGMTLEELGNRIGLDRSRVYRIEQAEVHGDLKLSTLEKMADGLGVKFVYGFVPERNLEKIVREQARKIARKRLNRIDHSMKLELQGVPDEEQEEALNDLIDKILIEESQSFWDQ
ncbi:MAG TPA: mobile mystery protein A [Fodinibius sp.]|nr:mobile mystery protein A [Fodinibius sp.]